ncbi:MAG: DUF4916 domain-containing protein [Bifidobacterium dentium]
MLYHERCARPSPAMWPRTGDIALPLLPVGLQPFTVAEFFPTPGLERILRSAPARHRPVLRGAYRRRLQAAG